MTMDIGAAVRLVDKPGIRHCWEMLRRTARREVWLLGREQFARDVGVACRAMVDRACLGREDRLAELLRRARNGEAIRVVARIPTEMVIVDRRWALVPVVVDGRTTEVLLVRGSSLLTTLVATYETWWRGAIPLAELLEDPGHDAVDLRLVTLLAAGLTDKSIARELGIGLRTVQRQVRALLGRLSSQTRFQAGLQVGRLRLLETDQDVHSQRL